MTPCRILPLSEWFVKYIINLKKLTPVFFFVIKANISAAVLRPIFRVVVFKIIQHVLPNKFAKSIFDKLHKI